MSTGTSPSAHLSLIIVTLGLMLCLTSGAGWIWGYLTKEVPPAFGRGAVRPLHRVIDVMRDIGVSAVEPSPREFEAADHHREHVVEVVGDAPR